MEITSEDIRNRAKWMINVTAANDLFRYTSTQPRLGNWGGDWGPPAFVKKIPGKQSLVLRRVRC